MKSGQSLPDIYQTYPKSGHTFGGHTPTHPTFGAPPMLYVICHSHTKQVAL